METYSLKKVLREDEANALIEPALNPPLSIDLKKYLGEFRFLQRQRHLYSREGDRSTG